MVTSGAIGSTGYDWESCKHCGKVRRADGNNKPCKGPVRVGPRSNPKPRTER